jgi:hypothetical protein
VCRWRGGKQRVLKRVFDFLLFLGDLINKVVTVGLRAVTATVKWVGRQKPAVLYGGALLLGFVLITGSTMLLTWMADSQRITQTPQEGGGGGSVPQEGISRGQQDEPPSEIAESSGTPEETVGATLSIVEEHGGVKPQTDATPTAQIGCVPGVAPEATTGPFMATSRVECANIAPPPPPVAPSPDKALPQAGGADVTSLLALATGSLLVGGGLLAFRFTRAARH